MTGTADEPVPIRCPACYWLVRPPPEHLDDCPENPAAQQEQEKK